MLRLHRFAALLLCALTSAQDHPPTPPENAPPASPPAEEVRGLKLREAGATPGYTLVAPLNSKDIHLVDLDGEVVHTWHTQHTPGAATYLLDNGNLLRCGQLQDNPRFHGGGIGGVLQELDWDGKLVWEYTLASSNMTLHHDLEVLPNGNLLAIAWEYHTSDEAQARGRDEHTLLEEGLWTDVLLEIRPTRPSGGELVWTWRSWDHLVQDRDPKLQNYGALSEHPGRIDLNADHRYEPLLESEAERKAREKLEEEMRALGYTGGEEPVPAPAGAPLAGGAPPAAGTPVPPAAPKKYEADWMHTNGIDHLPSQDLIVISSPHLCELFVLDHSTTTAQAATESGGRQGRGGALLWRWGNPRNYGRGEAADQRLFYQHNPTWLGDGIHELRLLVYNNGGQRPDGDWSSVDELVLPPLVAGQFPPAPEAAFGPAELAWRYSDGTNFFSAFISSAQRLPNGNTLICAGAPGRVFEISPAKFIVWEWLNPLGGEVEPTKQGGRAPAHALFRATRIPANHPALARLH